MVNDYYIELIRSKPINYNGLIFYPISFKDICDEIGLENFNNILIPFCITKDILDLSDEEIKKIDLFEDIILCDDYYSKCIAYALQIFCKCGDVYKKGKELIISLNTEEDNYIINKSNFDDICNIILKITGKEKIKVEKPPKNMSERQKDVWYKLQEGRKKDEEKNTVHIYDALNVCEFGGNYHIPIEEIETWTLWKIMNCYKARLNIKIYDDNLKICLVGGDIKNISGDNHWHKQLMIRE